MGGDGKGKGGKGDKGGGKGGYKGDKGGDKGGGFKGGKGGDKGGGFKGGKGKPASLPFRQAVATSGHDYNAGYVPPYCFNDGAPRLSSAGRLDYADVQKALAEVKGAMEKVQTATPGKKGTASKALANMIEIDFEKGAVFFQYDAKLSPEVKSRKTHRSLTEKVIKETYADARVIIVGDIVFCSKQLKDGDLNFKASAKEEDKKFRAISETFVLTLKQTQQVTTTRITQDLITVYSRVLKDVLERDDWQKIGRTHFDMAQEVPIANLNKVLIPGIHLTLGANSFGSGLAMTIDVVNKVVSTRTVYEELNLSNPKNHSRLSACIGTIMMTTYSAKDRKKRTVKIDGVDTSKNENTKMPELGDRSLREYFETQYQLKDIPKGQPLLFHEAMRKDKDGNQTKVKEYYLPSVLKVTGLAPELSDPQLRAHVTSMCAVKPNLRFEKIFGLAKKLFSANFKKEIAAWSLKLAPGFILSPARALPDPVIQMSSGYQKVGMSWRFDIDKRPQNPDPSTAFVSVNKAVAKVLVVMPPQTDYWWRNNSRNLQGALQYFAGGKKIDFKEHEIAGFDEQSIAAVFAQFTGKPDAYLVLAPKTDDKAYAAIKWYGTEYGVVTQVAKTTGDRPMKAITNNIAAQILVKRGNKAWKKKDCHFPDTMVVGVAQHHAGDGSGRGTKMSIMGVASSVDDELMGWTVSHVGMQAGETVSKKIKEPMLKALQKYAEERGKAPKEIVFFREGGSEGEIPLILLEEVKAIRDAMSELKVKATITFFLVLRKAHLRIAQGSIAETKIEVSSDGAPPPGTVMDSLIVNPQGFEFFLLSQLANIGSPSPIKYKCLLFEGKKLDADKYECMANDLACMYYNWQGPIALPAPLMYAQRDAKMVGDCLLDPNTGKIVSPTGTPKFWIPNI
ncbi:Piwi [Diplonema papillatum]|nr:Piwi [Diplonema papillatum]